MSDWTLKKLSDVAEIIGGGTPSSSKNEYFENGNIPWLTPKDLSNYHYCYIERGERNITKLGLAKSSAKILPKGTVLLTSRAPIGYVAIAKNEISTNQGFKSLVLNKGQIPEFYYYLLKHNVPLLEARATGSTFKEISGKILKETELNIPTTEIQKKIVDILRPIDKKIEINKETNQTLEAIAQALFKSWFIDFDPVRAKARVLNSLSLGERAGVRGQTQATIEAMKILSGKTTDQLSQLAQENPKNHQRLQTTAEAFPSGFDDTGIPEGWEMKPLSSFGDIVCGKTPSKKKTEYYGDDIPLIKIPDMHNNAFVVNTTDNLSLLGADSQNKKYIEKGSVCVSCIATVGLVSIASQKSQTNQQINSIKPKKDSYSKYLYLSLSNRTMIKYLQDLASGGSATLNLNTTSFSKIRIVKASDGIIDLFNFQVSSLFEQILQNALQNERLQESRDILLPKLLSGEIGF